MKKKPDALPHYRIQGATPQPQSSQNIVHEQRGQSQKPSPVFSPASTVVHTKTRITNFGGQYPYPQLRTDMDPPLDSTKTMCVYQTDLRLPNEHQRVTRKRAPQRPNPAKELVLETRERDIIAKVTTDLKNSQDGMERKILSGLQRVVATMETDGIVKWERELKGWLMGRLCMSINIGLGSMLLILSINRHAISVSMYA